MKKISIFLMVIVAVMMTSCNSNTYSNQRKAENALIANYLSRQGYNILTELPDDSYVWDEKDYYQVNGYDQLYFHLIQRGDSERIIDQDTIKIPAIKSNETIILRYKQFSLTENADTASYWTTLDSAYPVEFKYLTDYTNACKGWQIAVQLMKYPGSQCQVIVPSKLGFSTNTNSVTPYGYIMKIKVDR